MNCVPSAQLKRVSHAAARSAFGRRTGSDFAGLVEAIAYQQLAGPAARAIHSRMVAALDDDVQPEALLALSDETLRAAGLSPNKARSLRDLAAKVLDGTVVLSPRGLSRQSDEEVIARLSTVRGIGPWTAQMAAIRPDRHWRCRPAAKSHRSRSAHGFLDPHLELVADHVKAFLNDCGALPHGSLVTRPQL